MQTFAISPDEEEFVFVGLDTIRGDPASSLSFFDLQTGEYERVLRTIFRLGKPNWIQVGSAESF